MALPDPAQRMGCPDAFPALPALAPLQPFSLPDGRKVVLLDRVRERESVVSDYLIGPAMGAWHACRTVVRYDDDWIAGMARLPGAAR